MLDTEHTGAFTEIRGQCWGVRSYLLLCAFWGSNSCCCSRWHSPLPLSNLPNFPRLSNSIKIPSFIAKAVEASQRGSVNYSATPLTPGSWSSDWLLSARTQQVGNKPRGRKMCCLLLGEKHLNPSGMDAMHGNGVHSQAATAALERASGAPDC